MEENSLEARSELSRDQLVKCLPNKSMAKYVTDDILDLVNGESDLHLREVYRENMLGYSSVLAEGRYSLQKYVEAVKFASHRMLGANNTLAYAKVFPDRYQDLVDKGTPTKEIASFASSYSKNQLVVKIFEQTLVPTHILNADLHQEAINTQAELMRSARSETVRQKAAESLIVNLKAPEVAKVELDVNVNNDMIDDLRATTRALAKQQQELITKGLANAKEVAHSDIIATKVEAVDAEYSEVDR